MGSQNDDFASAQAPVVKDSEGRAGLIQTLIITKVPILIGSGIPLFGEVPHDIKLRHLETLQFDNGLVQSKYKILENNV